MISPPSRTLAALAQLGQRRNEVVKAQADENAALRKLSEHALGCNASKAVHDELASAANTAHERALQAYEAWESELDQAIAICDETIKARTRLS